MPEVTQRARAQGVEMWSTEGLKERKGLRLVFRLIV